MAKSKNDLTCSAGEYFVAYRLSSMGYLVALTRVGSASVDMMVCSPNGEKTVTIQVKTANKAFSPRTKKNPGYWEWILGPNGNKLRGESVFYAFVDLNRDEKESSTSMLNPRVFIVPAKHVAEHLLGYPKPPKKADTFWFDIDEANKNDWLEAWHYIQEKLPMSSGS
jgi:hypothetical protein